MLHSTILSNGETRGAIEEESEEVLDKPVIRFTGYLVGSGRGKFTSLLCIKWDTMLYRGDEPYREDL